MDTRFVFLPVKHTKLDLETTRWSTLDSHRLSRRASNRLVRSTNWQCSSYVWVRWTVGLILQKKSLNGNSKYGDRFDWGEIKREDRAHGAKILCVKIAEDLWFTFDSQASVTVQLIAGRHARKQVISWPLYLVYQPITAHVSRMLSISTFSDDGTAHNNSQFEIDSKGTTKDGSCPSIFFVEISLIHETVGWGVYLFGASSRSQQINDWLTKWNKWG